MVKYLVRILCCLYMIFLLTGCERQERAEVSRFDDSKQYLYFESFVESEDGIYHTEVVDSGEIIKYADLSSGKDTVLCSKINCKHNSEKCQAFVKENDFIMGMLYAKGKLYLLVSGYKNEGGPRSNCIYQMDKDGRGKVLIHDFKDYPVMANVGGLYKNRFFLSIQVLEMEEDGSGGSSGAPSILMYDLNTKKEAVILDGYKENDTFKQIVGGNHNSIYIAERNFYEKGDCHFREYDFLTGEFDDLYTTPEENLQAIRDDTLYLQKKEEKKIYVYNMKTQMMEELLSWEEDVANIYIRYGYIEFVKEEKNVAGETVYLHKWYDLEEFEYLFDEYRPESELTLKRKLTDIYWFVKDGKNYFYNWKEKVWTEIEEIS